jgi:hypothetical protein
MNSISKFVWVANPCLPVQLAAKAVAFPKIHNILYTYLPQNQFFLKDSFCPDCPSLDGVSYPEVGILFLQMDFRKGVLGGQHAPDSVPCFAKKKRGSVSPEYPPWGFGHQPLKRPTLSTQSGSEGACLRNLRNLRTGALAQLAQTQFSNVQATIQVL